jgi:hypothetical protein
MSCGGVRIARDPALRAVEVRALAGLFGASAVADGLIRSCSAVRARAGVRGLCARGRGRGLISGGNRADFCLKDCATCSLNEQQEFLNVQT